MKILVLNAGSSTQKSCLYEFGDERTPDGPCPPLWEARLDGVQLKVTTARGETLSHIPEGESCETIARMLETIWRGPDRVLESLSEIDIVGHRVVHGGRDYTNATLVDGALKAAIASLAELAPAHNPAALRGIEAVGQALGPTVPQLAVFDTAFHSTLSEAAAIYPGPYEWVEQGIRRYGFHGINHAYCADRAAQILNRDPASLRLVSCHLGNGCSLAAISGGRSVDTTMGFTPLEGLMMGTRSGTVDPGILLHLLRKGRSVDDLDCILNRESGLKGISGLGGDMRDISAAVLKGDLRAQLAFDIYVHRVRAHIGSMAAVLGGLDGLVFTAGVGENSAPLRAAVCQKFGFLGLKLDSGKNEASPLDEDIAVPNSHVRILVIQAQEDWAIARECWNFLTLPKR